MILKKKTPEYSYLKNITITHNFNRIMFLSCVRISSNQYELTYMYDYIYNFNENRTLIPIKIIIPFETYKKIINTKFGVWLRVNDSFPFVSYIYIYKNLNNNKLIYKSLRNDNYMKNGNTNQYNHELIFKGTIRDNCILEYVR